MPDPKPAPPKPTKNPHLGSTLDTEHMAKTGEIRPLDTIPARKAVIGDTYDPLTAAQRLLEAGYDEPCLRMVVAGEIL